MHLSNQPNRQMTWKSFVAYEMLKKKKKHPEKWSETIEFCCMTVPPHISHFWFKITFLRIISQPFSTTLFTCLYLADFYLFLWLKIKLKEQSFSDLEDIIQNATRQLGELSKKGFQLCFQQLNEHWGKSVNAN